jgi:DNA-binding NarL/FixJ family response regulator
VTDHVRVLIADDHVLFRRGLGRVLEQQGMEIVGEAPNGKVAVQLAHDLQPDVVVMDFSMPVMDGVEATRAIIADNPGARVFMLTITADEAQVLDAMLAGACGYELKDATAANLVYGVSAAAQGQSLISPRIAAHLVKRLREVSQARPSTVDEAADLTTREVEVLRLVAEGKENSQIANELFISPKTVKNHVASILDKLAIENRIQAAVFAVRIGISR